MKTTSRTFQVAGMVVLLLAAIVLTTALVVAAEQSSESSNKSVWHKSSMQAPFVTELGPKGWA